MLFQVKDTSGRIMFYTEYESCIPVDNLDSMNSSGLCFYLDGKKTSANAIRSRFPSVKSAPQNSQRRFSDGVKKPQKSKPRQLAASKIQKHIDFSKIGFPITSRTIVCLTNGKVYKNQSEAAKDLNIDPSYISDCVCHNKEYKGLKFKKAVELK